MIGEKDIAGKAQKGVHLMSRLENEADEKMMTSCIT